MTKGWGMLERNVDRMTVMVKGFLSYSKKRELKILPSDPKKIATEVFSLYEATAKKHGIHLSFESDDELGLANMEATGIHTCLANLISNALDACKTSCKNGCSVTLRLEESDGAIVFEVEDTGSGMTPEVKEKVFNSFFTTKGLEGTGLGLLVTQKTVQEHGGFIEMDSEPGKGSFFRMVFPRKNLPKLTQFEPNKSKPVTQRQLEGR